ncbi:TetR/AcrR family transcriptional regulator [Mycobacterium sp. URHB0044]|uniref:TetR/AcrR family transcriptional regulator n=1 Tax=Mycobacterium sp. URHB0044 TaxID=1380386 RepID=UPI00048EDC98|nr:TetR/AcrR family transcriptional regulator [Mycobacterium sp. URHB0044]
MTAASRTGRPTRAAAKKLDERLRQAAVDTFLQYGFDGATMEAVARAAGISKKTLYTRYADKHALFASVIPWALSRLELSDADDEHADEDLAASLISLGRAAISRAVDPDRAKLLRIALDESDRFPEFGVAAHSLLWSAQQRAVMETLERFREPMGLEIANVEIAAEQFIAMVALVPGRMADFGIFRSPEVEEQHLEHAVALFVRGILPRWQ